MNLKNHIDEIDAFFEQSPSEIMKILKEYLPLVPVDIEVEEEAHWDIMWSSRAIAGINLYTFEKSKDWPEEESHAELSEDGRYSFSNRSNRVYHIQESGYMITDMDNSDSTNSYLTAA